jgi:hypothetical protein
MAYNQKETVGRGNMPKTGRDIPMYMVNPNKPKEDANTYTYTHPKTGKKVKMDKRSPEYKHLKLKDKTISKRNQLGE